MVCVAPGREDQLASTVAEMGRQTVIQLSMIGIAVALSCLFTSMAGWQQVAHLFKETEQERIDREFFSLVATIDLEA